VNSIIRGPATGAVFVAIEVVVQIEEEMEALGNSGEAIQENASGGSARERDRHRFLAVAELPGYLRRAVLKEVAEIYRIA
jgi:hypothetical protein